VPVSLAEAAAMFDELPEVVERERHGARTWFVNDKAIAWERGYSKADLERFGDEIPPAPPLLALQLADLGEKEATGTAALTLHVSVHPAVP
jgi:hypothetical protein